MDFDALIKKYGFRAPKRKGHPEDDLQKACVRWFALRYRRYSPLLWHIPNGGRRDAAEAAKFKEMGVRAGVPDLEFALPNKFYHGLYIEMKSEKGRQSEKQKRYQFLLEGQGYRYVVCRSLQDFQDIMNDYIKER